MAIPTNNEHIPEKFRGMEESFIAHLSVKDTSSFKSFPKHASFLGKEDDENVILMIRSHWIRYINYIVSSVLILIVPIVVALLIPSIRQNVSLFVAIMIMSILIAMSFAIYGFLLWFYNINIITDRRVVDLDFKTIFSHSSSEARLDKIEDVTSKQGGTFSNILDIGTVHIQTAGTNAYIEFDNVPKPREIQDVLSDLLELTQKKKI